jgi:RNA polymerase sigma-70 factor (ECF subfamily)
VDVYSPLLYGFCRNRNLQSSDAADITQEVLLRIAKAIRSFEYDREKGLFRDWLARIVLNEIRRHGKSKSPVVTPIEGLDDDLGTIESEWNDQFQQHIFAKAMERTKTRFNDETWALFEKT